MIQNDHYIMKLFIGWAGTGLSVALQNLSEVAAILAAISTAIYMVIQARNALAKGKAFKEDRENDNTNEGSE